MLYYYLPIILNVYCIYHIIKNKNTFNWIFLIIFIPVIGSIIYILMNVINKNDVEKVQEGLTSVINPTKKVKELTQKLAFSETFQNKVDLADAYFELNDFQNASHYYKNALNSNFSNDAYVISKLTEALFSLKDYKNVIKYYEQLEDLKYHIKAQNHLNYGLSLNELGETEFAEIALKKVDLSFSNYNERVRLAEFYIEKGNTKKAKVLLEEILEESLHFTKPNRKLYRFTINKVKMILKNL